MSKPLVYKKPIKILCAKTGNSTKLIKGAIYSATKVLTYYNNDKFAHISIGTYSLDYFTYLDGSSLKDIPEFVLSEELDKNVDYTGKCVKCAYSSGKFLKKDEIYYVESQKIFEWGEKKFKIRGIDRYRLASNFKEISIGDQRKIKLKNLIGDKIKTGELTRKFLLYSEKEKTQILLQLLVNCINDTTDVEFTEQINIVKMILIKGEKYNLIEEDVKPFINSVKSILIPYDFLVV